LQRYRGPYGGTTNCPQGNLWWCGWMNYPGILSALTSLVNSENDNLPIHLIPIRGYAFYGRAVPWDY
jgi:hypothetical protein